MPCPFSDFCLLLFLTFLLRHSILMHLLLMLIPFFFYPVVLMHLLLIIIMIMHSIIMHFLIMIMYILIIHHSCHIAPFLESLSLIKGFLTDGPFFSPCFSPYLNHKPLFLGGKF